MTYIIFKIAGENRTATHEEMVILNTLSLMTDYDMQNLDYMFENIIVIKKGTSDKKFDIEKLPQDKMGSCFMTLNLLSSNGVIRKNVSSIDANEIGAIMNSSNESQIKHEEHQDNYENDSDYYMSHVTNIFRNYMYGVSQLYRDALSDKC